MTDLFLSHSSNDKPLAQRIAADLVEAGVTVWMDEWKILVGDSITQKIQQGISECRFLAVLLTTKSVKSGWVQKEWQAKVGEEAQKQGVVILPLRGDACEIPPLLRDKKYADFAQDYHTALNDLLGAIE